jgi:thiol-disulfide isomerase/thioredoxin
MQNKEVSLKRILTVGISVFLLWTLQGCSTKKVSEPEKFGSIFVVSNIPGADIILDNEPTGKQTPDTLPSVKVGSHLIEVEMAGYLPSPGSVMIQVEADTTVRASFTLLSLSYGSLSVNSNVQAAYIALDNVATDKQTPFLSDSITVGTHIVSIYKDGYSNDAPAKEVVNISTADTVRLVFNLSPGTIGNNVGNITPDFNLEDDFGKRHRLYAHRGFVSMINFWALSCHYCMVELPYLQELQNEYLSDSLKIFAVNYEDDFDIMRQKRNELALTFNLLKDDAGVVKSDYEVTGTPVTIIIDRSGKIHYYKLGFPDQPDKIGQEMEKFRQKLNELFGE